MATKKRKAVSRRPVVVDWYVIYRRLKLADGVYAEKGQVVVTDQRGNRWAMDPAEFDQQFKVLDA